MAASRPGIPAQGMQEPIPQLAGSHLGDVEEVHPLGVAALGVLVVLVLILPRRLLPLPFVLLMCLIPGGQRFVFFTLDFPYDRILLLATWFRLLLGQELRLLAWHALDLLMLGWAVVSVFAATLLWGSVGAFVGSSGTAFDVLATYFLVRHVVRRPEDLEAMARFFLLGACIVLPCLVVERATGRNLFAFLGGVPEFSEIREGRLRCQGAFAHSILAGCFFASLIPMFLATAWIRGRWLQALFGVVTSLAIVVLSASSTPVMAVFFAILGLVWFPLRHLMPALRWGIACTLVALHLVMKMPVWHLIARIDVAGGSTGWHRYHLIDQFIHRAPEWLLVGTWTTGHWGWGLDDVTNQFVFQGVTGGILKLLLFVLIICFAFAGVSHTLRSSRHSRGHSLLAWSLGTMLFVHCMNFLAVTYFGQIVMLWNLLLGIMGSLLAIPGALRRFLPASAAAQTSILQPAPIRTP